MVFIRQTDLSPASWGPRSFWLFRVIFLEKMEVEVDDQIPFINRNDDDGGLLPSSVIQIARAFYVATNEKAALTGSSILRYAILTSTLSYFELIMTNNTIDFRRIIDWDQTFKCFHID